MTPGQRATRARENYPRKTKNLRSSLRESKRKAKEITRDKRGSLKASPDPQRRVLRMSLTEEDIKAIKEDIKRGLSPKQICMKYHISPVQYSEIKDSM